MSKETEFSKMEDAWFAQGEDAELMEKRATVEETGTLAKEDFGEPEEFTAYSKKEKYDFANEELARVWKQIENFAVIDENQSELSVEEISAHLSELEMKRKYWETLANDSKDDVDVKESEAAADLAVEDTLHTILDAHVLSNAENEKGTVSTDTHINKEEKNEQLMADKFFDSLKNYIQQYKITDGSFGDVGAVEGSFEAMAKDNFSKESKKLWNENKEKLNEIHEALPDEVKVIVDEAQDRGRKNGIQRLERVVIGLQNDHEIGQIRSDIKKVA